MNTNNLDMSHDRPSGRMECIEYECTSWSDSWLSHKSRVWVQVGSWVAHSLSFLICNSGILTLCLLHRPVLRIKQDNQLVINTANYQLQYQQQHKEEETVLERTGKEVTLHLKASGRFDWHYGLGVRQPRVLTLEWPLISLGNWGNLLFSRLIFFYF